MSEPTIIPDAEELERIAHAVIIELVVAHQESRRPFNESRRWRTTRELCKVVDAPAQWVERVCLRLHGSGIVSLAPNAPTRWSLSPAIAHAVDRRKAADDIIAQGLADRRRREDGGADSGGEGAPDV